jgi:uncharacterized Rmd1/YagE family protein
LIANDREPYEIFRDKLAFSHGIANSVKLGALEKLLDNHIDSVRHIPEIMRLGQSLPIKRAEVMSKIGELLSFRAQLNLHSELLETPDIYWSEPHLEDLYNKIVRILDVRPRVSTLNRKLDYANELTQILRNHLSEKHGLTLEWTIIILIFVEVIFGTINLLTGSGH